MRSYMISVPDLKTAKNDDVVTDVGYRCNKRIVIFIRKRLCSVKNINDKGHSDSKYLKRRKSKRKRNIYCCLVSKSMQHPGSRIKNKLNVLVSLPNEFKNFGFVMFTNLHSFLHDNDNVTDAVVGTLLRVLLRSTFNHSHSLITNIITITLQLQQLVS